MSENNTPMEDISSTSPEFKAKKEPVLSFLNNVSDNLGNVVKCVAFVVAFAVIIVGFTVAFLIFTKTFLSALIAFVAVIIFTCIAACLFFPIYGIGQILCQNEEILKKLNK